MAFNSDPFARWVYPAPGDYLAHGSAFTEAFAGPAFTLGTAFVTEEYEGGSLWMPPGASPDAEAFARVIGTTVREEIHGELEELFGQFETLHITEPHWYLAVIGVEPWHHGRGIGGALLEHTLAICDGEGLPAYLESSNPRNIPLYRRHGFEVVGEIQAGTSPVISAMLRPRKELWASSRPGGMGPSKLG